MGSDLSVLVNSYLEYEEYPVALKKKISRKFLKAIKGREKDFMAKMQSGEVEDNGRNEEIILKELRPNLRADAYKYLYSPWLTVSSLCQQLVS